MKYMNTVFSLAFFLTALISLFLGIFIIRLKPKANINRAFLFVCISLSIWSIGFSFANSAESINESIFWRRVAAIGWTSIVSITLHFLLLISMKNLNKRKEKLLYILHIPAFLNMYIFSISKNIAPGQYNLIKNVYGWVNITVNNKWDYIYYLFYGIYMILGLFTLFKWKNRLRDKKKIRQVNLIFLTLFIALILSSITDNIISTIFKNPLPQMAPIFILIPTWAMYYSARYCGIIVHKKEYKKDIIATEKDREKIFYNISLAFLLGGLVSFIFDYSQLIKNTNGSLLLAGIKAFMFILTGSLIYIIQKIEKTFLREKLTIIILVVNIPILALHFLEYSSATIWVFPIIIMMVSLVFSKKTLLISTAIVSIITQRLIWILKPEVTIVLDKYDYILRILVLITASLVAFYINKIYLSKMEENEHQITFQQIDSDISTEFITINKNNAEEKINLLLQKLGKFFQVDRTYVFLIDSKEKTMTYAYEWCNKGIKKEVGTIKEISLDVFPWWIDRLEKDEIVYIEDVSQMQDQAKAEKEQLLRQEVKSLISVPIRGNGYMQGFIGMDSVKDYKKWTDKNIKLLNILSNVLSDGLRKLKYEKEIEFMAYYDQLTMLPNRFLFQDRVDQAIALSKRTGRYIAIVLIDLDNFKMVNDSVGHSGGDILLKKVAKNLRSIIREIDSISRFGGDEFMILVNNIEKPKDIKVVGDKIIHAFSKPYILSQEEFFITASAGIAIFPLDGDDSESLIKNADTAMHKAKYKGKNQYAICTSYMKDEVEDLMRLSNDLYYALERDELLLYYQPQIDIKSKKIIGFEALLRWDHPILGMVSPGVFIPIAEKNGLINEIGEWVIETACAKNKELQNMGMNNSIMAVNLSGIQFLNPKIAEDISRILRETGLNPKYLEIEITESIAIKEIDFVVEVLNKLKKIGVSIAIDDFGTEYSSLSRLKLLPIDRIKIDMEFIQGIETDEKNQAITSVIIRLAKSLKLNVLAEGVETLPQLDFLRQEKCDHVQGYYFYKPMSAEKTEKLVDI